MKIFAVVSLLAVSAAAVTPDQVWCYLAASGSPSPDAMAKPPHVVLAANGAAEPLIRSWRVPGIPEPSAAQLQDPAVASAARAAWPRTVVDGGLLRPMDAAEAAAAKASEESARQAAKSAKLKAAENAVVGFLRSEGAIAAGAVSVTPDQLDAMFASWDALPDAQSEKKSTKYDRLLKAVERRGGSEGDVRFHE